MRSIVLVSVFVVGLLVSACSNTSTAPSATSVVITGNTTLTAVGQTTQLTASQTVTGGTPQNVTSVAAWTSSSVDIATVSSAGLVTAVAPGVTTVTATYQGESGTLSISVSTAAPPTGPATYNYTGNMLTTFTSGQTCPPVCQITGSFTVATALAANLASASPTIQSFTFTDGNTTVTQANGKMTRLSVSTDANGQIILPWVFEVQTTTPSGIVMLWVINQLPNLGGASDGSAFVTGSAGSAFNLTSPGGWSQ